MSRRDIDPLDPYGLESALDADHALVRDTIRRFVRESIEPTIGRWFRDEHFESGLVPAMGDLGLLGAAYDGYGCAGLDALAYGLICRELERGDSAYRSFVSVQSSLVIGAIHACGSIEQKSRYIPRLAAGELIGCFALTESHGGSDPSNLKTRAIREGDSWRLSGDKEWITNGGIADLAVVWAATETGIEGFIVERGTTGFEQQSITGKLSLRASDTGILRLRDAAVGDVQRLERTDGLKSALRCLDDARYGICWGAVGAAQSCLEEALDFVRDRELFGQRLNRKQLVQARLAEVVRLIGGAGLAAMRLAELKSAGSAHPAQVSLTKWSNVQAALKVARICRDILGAAGITTAHRTMRHMLNLESVVTYEGTESIHTLVVGRAITGESAF